MAVWHLTSTTLRACAPDRPGCWEGNGPVMDRAVRLAAELVLVLCWHTPWKLASNSHCDHGAALAGAHDATQAPSLPDLPVPLLLHICKVLTEQRAGSPRDVVACLWTCKALRATICSADELWTRQCTRLGWGLEWLPLCPSPPAWTYFSRRMRARWVLRQQLRRLNQFLDPLSRASFRPRASREALEETEAALQLRLPWALFELYCWADGQEPRSGVQFAQGARLLTLLEMQHEVQGELGPAQLGKAFSGWLAAQTGGTGDNANSFTGADPGLAGRASDAGSSSERASGSEGSSASRRQHAGVLLPFTDKLRGGKQFCMDLDGCVWLKGGMYTSWLADSLMAFVKSALGTVQASHMG